MDLARHYQAMYSDAVPRIRSGRYETDPLIDSPADNRRGMSLVTRISGPVRENIRQFTDELKKIDPWQYYYPEQDLHITILPVISCYEGFHLSLVKPADYIRTIEKGLTGARPFVVNFRGVTASPGCIMVQGFFDQGGLGQLRDKLRLAILKSRLQQSIDQRYPLRAAHITVVRFRSGLINAGGQIQVLEKYRDFDFGSFPVNEIELVFNDWYLREKSGKLLHTYPLQEPETEA